MTSWIPSDLLILAARAGGEVKCCTRSSSFTQIAKVGCLQRETGWGALSQQQENQCGPSQSGREKEQKQPWFLRCSLPPPPVPLPHTVHPHKNQTVYLNPRMCGMCHSLIGMKQSAERQGGALLPRGPTVQGLWVLRAGWPLASSLDLLLQPGYQMQNCALSRTLGPSCFWWPRRVNTLKENNKVGRLMSPDFKTYYHATVIKIVRYWQKKRWVD